MTTICGIDEAGRGPIIGPMIICGILVDKRQLPILEKLKVKDSKALTTPQREKISVELKKRFKYKLISVSPQEIDAVVLADSKDVNLNWLEAEKAVELIDALKPDEVIMDCPSPNIKAFTSFIMQRIKRKCALLCAHHADAKYPVVSAASILAKTARDEAVEKIKRKIGIDFGSGYVADPRTKEFLEKHWNDYPEIFRHSWAPYRKESELQKQKRLGEF
ncbi:MAG: ribonuclease HII [Candidatus Woesearchaeota archaeon]